MVCRYQAAVEIWDLVVDQRCWTLIVVRQAETVRHTGHVQKLIAQHIWTCTDRKQRWKYQEFNHQMYVSVCFHVCSLTDSEPFWSKEHSPCNIYHKVHVILDNLILIGISSRGIWVQTETRFPVFTEPHNPATYMPPKNVWALMVRIKTKGPENLLGSQNPPWSAPDNDICLAFSTVHLIKQYWYVQCKHCTSRCMNTKACNNYFNNCNNNF